MTQYTVMIKILNTALMRMWYTRNLYVIGSKEYVENKEVFKR